MGSHKPYVAAIALLLCAQFARADCATEFVDLKGDWGQARFSIDVADDAEERGRGLMFVDEMPMMSGMLFVYETPRRVSFWMKNTLIPLDMIFTDVTGVVQHVHAEAVPLDETPIPGGDDIYAVLEVNGGMAARLGIEPGTVLRHPAFDTARAAWPCDVQ